jgi:hypothetical protein
MAEEITLWRGRKNSQHFTEDERQAARTQKEENKGRERGGNNEGTKGSVSATRASAYTAQTLTRV